MRLRIFACLFGFHQKRWAGVVDFKLPSPSDLIQCDHGKNWWPGCDPCSTTVQIAKWYCECCTKMGERWIKKGEGLYTVKHGYLVPDEKRWGDGSDPQNKNGLPHL